MPKSKTDAEFIAWMKEVDEILASKCAGMTHDDMPDKDWRGMHEAGDTPLDAARFLIEDEGHDPDDFGFDEE